LTITSLSFSHLSVLLLGIIDNGICRLGTLRIFSIVTISLQLVMTFREPLKRWFEKAHQAARDDRYLIGEILLNWEERS
jgi:hypothetical protein